MSEMEDIQPEEEIEQPTLSVEERAQAVGWKPDGDLDAETFLARREENMGFMRHDLEKLEAKLAESHRTQEHMAKMVESWREESRLQGYEQARKEIQAQKEQAIEEGDKDAFFDAQKRETELEQKASSEKQNEQRKEVINQLQTKIAAETERHPELFETSSRKEAFAKEFRYQLSRGKPIDDAIKVARNEVMTTFNLIEKVPSGDSGKASTGGKGKDFRSMPKEVKESYAKFKATMPDLTEEEYAQTYWEQFNEE